jgi:hypothetical protein
MQIWIAPPPPSRGIALLRSFKTEYGPTPRIATTNEPGLAFLRDALDHPPSGSFFQTGSETQVWVRIANPGLTPKPTTFARKCERPLLGLFIQTAA